MKVRGETHEEHVRRGSSSFTAGSLTPKAFAQDTVLLDSAGSVESLAPDVARNRYEHLAEIYAPSATRGEHRLRR
jgi:hypothetical protein